MVIKVLIALSVLLNIVLIVGVLVAVSFATSEKSTVSMLNYFISSKLDDKGCIAKTQSYASPETIQEFGEDALVCFRMTIENPSDEILFPKSLKGQKYIQ